MNLVEILFWVLFVILLVLLYKVNTTAFWIVLILGLLLAIYRFATMPTIQLFDAPQINNGVLASPIMANDDGNFFCVGEHGENVPCGTCYYASNGYCSMCVEYDGGCDWVDCNSAPGKCSQAQVNNVVPKYHPQINGNNKDIVLEGVIISDNLF